MFVSAGKTRHMMLNTLLFQFQVKPTLQMNSHRGYEIVSTYYSTVDDPGSD